jgi:hypothetical protein
MNEHAFAGDGVCMLCGKTRRELKNGASCDRAQFAVGNTLRCRSCGGYHWNHASGEEYVTLPSGTELATHAKT